MTYINVILVALGVFFFAGLVLNQMAEFNKSLSLEADCFVVTTLTSTDRIDYDEVISVTFQFGEESEGFSRMRLLGPLGIDHLPTVLMYQINTDSYMYYETLRNIEHKQVELLIETVSSAMNLQPQVQNIDSESIYGEVFYFSKKMMNYQPDSEAPNYLSN